MSLMKFPVDLQGSKQEKTMWLFEFFAHFFAHRNPINVCVFSESGHVPSTTAPAPMPSYCLTSNGQRYEEGDSWHDGCRDCYCHSGREMCVLISCPVPSCSHPVVKPDQCCPTCEGMSQQLHPFLKDNCWFF